MPVDDGPLRSQSCDALKLDPYDGASYPNAMEEPDEGFLGAARIMSLKYLTSSDVRIASAGATALVPLAALGVEIALRSIARRVDHGEQCSHDLGELWDRLDKQTRVEIEAFERSLRRRRSPVEGCWWMPV